MSRYIFDLKKCPKCGRFMMDDSVHIQGDKWKIRWRCLCGHVEEEIEDA